MCFFAVLYDPKMTSSATLILAVNVGSGGYLGLKTRMSNYTRRIKRPPFF